MRETTDNRSHFIDRPSAPAVSISAGVVVALIWSASSPSTYESSVNQAWHLRLFADAGLQTTHDMVASLLMTVFFFAIGLELARERRHGALARLRHAAPPVFAALGGMLATALLAIAIGLATNTPALRHGWGIPMATDIAFTLGILTLVGRGLPPTLRVFLLALAIADDVFSVLVLAVTGASALRPAGVASTVLVALVGRAALRHRTSAPLRWLYVFGLWIALTWANVEPALAGVIAGAVLPYDDRVAPRLERTATRWSTVVVLPMFSLVSCGVAWDQLRFHGATVRIILAVVAIRIIGKVVGITAGVFVASRLRLPPPPSITGPILRAGSVLCAIGFTVPLLFDRALFASGSTTYGAFALGLEATSVVAAVLGGVLLRRLAKP